MCGENWAKIFLPMEKKYQVYQGYMHKGRTKKIMKLFGKFSQIVHPHTPFGNTWLKQNWGHFVEILVSFLGDLGVI